MSTSAQPFKDRIALIEQYNAGLVTFLELCLNMHMSSDELDAVLLMKAAHADNAMRAKQLATTLDDMVEKQRKGLATIPKLVY
jgi:hypothetical protein